MPQMSDELFNRFVMKSMQLIMRYIQDSNQPVDTTWGKVNLHSQHLLRGQLMLLPALVVGGFIYLFINFI